jgi:soluble lytic murein transglycosylase-like protein
VNALTAVALSALALLGGLGRGLTPPPAPGARLPSTPVATAAALVSTDASLQGSIDRWLASGAPRPPQDVTLYALYEQRLYRKLARDRTLAQTTLARLPAPLAGAARDVVTARRELFALTPPTPRIRIHVGPAAEPARLLAFYREAQRRFGVDPSLLAAINMVESAFGRVRSPSGAGAQGPMQFLPATWRRYGLGGDVHDPHDAILGAANYLHANGAPTRTWNALWHYNPSRLYVDAVLRTARRIRADRRTFYGFYAWQVYVRTPKGDVRLTGPGLG